MVVWLKLEGLRVKVVCFKVVWFSDILTTLPDSRFPIPDSRFPIPDSRFPKTTAII
ncbi:hypothetical protein [Moorena bouillonii]|uniref:hypothetical protein n=1 Tax=Moorena bouillonii TaxID=207920 RepID=UPI0013019817|nr:hypothetical protein [Moorena bouillonii]